MSKPKTNEEYTQAIKAGMAGRIYEEQQAAAAKKAQQNNSPSAPKKK